MLDLPLLQLVGEVKRRALEELQLQEQSPGKLLGVKHNCLHGFTDHLPVLFNCQSQFLYICVVPFGISLINEYLKYIKVNWSVICV